MSFEFLDNDVESGNAYSYRIVLQDAGGSRVLFETVLISSKKLFLTLHQNSPNPFNPSTTISYCVPERCMVRVEVLDVMGRIAARLVDSEHARGSHSVEWRRTDDKCNRVASGMYFYRLTAGKETISKKMLLLK